MKSNTSSSAQKPVSLHAHWEALASTTSPTMTAGREFADLHAQWLSMTPGDERDDLCDVLNARVNALRAMPCASVEELPFKALGVAWTFGITHRPTPTEDEDYLAFVLASLLSDIQSAAG